MKKVLISLAVMLLAFAVPSGAQTKKSQENKSLRSQVSGLWKKTKNGVVDATHKVGDAIGFNDGKVDETEIDGTYYMPLYTTNLYKKDEAKSLKVMCEKQFKARYAQAVVLSEAIPQTDWLTEPVKKNDEVIGYMETMFCYILAKDGGDGYINARFVFQKYRDVGATYSPVKDKWPKWERTDILTNNVYAKLSEKQ